jgi:hypothetical protein
MQEETLPDPTSITARPPSSTAASSQRYYYTGGEPQQMLLARCGVIHGYTP